MNKPRGVRACRRVCSGCRRSIARSEHRQACHSAFRGSARKWTARYSTRHSQHGSPSIVLFWVFYRKSFLASSLKQRRIRGDQKKLSQSIFIKLSAQGHRCRQLNCIATTDSATLGNFHRQVNHWTRHIQEPERSVTIFQKSLKCDVECCFVDSIGSTRLCGKRSSNLG